MCCLPSVPDHQNILAGKSAKQNSRIPCRKKRRTSPQRIRHEHLITPANPGDRAGATPDSGGLSLCNNKRCTSRCARTTEPDQSLVPTPLLLLGHHSFIEFAAGLYPGSQADKRSERPSAHNHNPNSGSRQSIASKNRLLAFRLGRWRRGRFQSDSGCTETSPTESAARSAYCGGN